VVVKPPALFGGAADPLNPTGVVITLLAAVFCSFAMVSIRYIGKRASPLQLAMWFHGRD
jgi:drug/metabolite transporter (DMT)-like permease